MMVFDFLKNIPVVISRASLSFRKNNDLSAASSLAFSASLALIPVFFLLTLLLDAVIGSSRAALAWTQELLNQLIPAFSQDILREVRALSAHRGTVGLLNMVVLLWSMTPLVADMRIFLGAIFQKKPTRPFLMEKLFDAVISIVFLMGLSVIAVAGVIFTLIESRSHYSPSFGYIGGMAPFLFVTIVLFSIYLVFSARARLHHLLIGALAASSLWFAMRPVFHLFLVYNPGYGFAFGSFKSLFVVLIWIYCSFVAFLVGAEIAAGLGRVDTVFIRRLMEGEKNVPVRIKDKYVKYYEKGSVIFREGEQGTEMYSVLQGSVKIVKGEQELAVIPKGKFFGEMSYLLSAQRVAAAVALDDVELVAIGNENIIKLMNEDPEFILEMLRDIARRLQATNNLID